MAVTRIARVREGRKTQFVDGVIDLLVSSLMPPVLTAGGEFLFKETVLVEGRYACKT
jgi:hypothetical protein